MAELGKYNLLTVTDIAPHGVYLDDDDKDPILLPSRQVPEGTKMGDELNVFVYLDSEDRWIATTQRPRVQIGQAAHLQVKDVNNMGAFLDWGLAKDLFVPFGEQKKKLQEGDHCIVYVLLDNTGRLIGTTRLNRHIVDEAKSSWPGAADPYQVGDQVDALVSHRTELGYKVIINDEFWGLVHHEDIRKAIRPGQRLKTYIKRVRDDKRLDISLEPIGQAKIAPLAHRIFKKLQEGDGTLGLSDRSPADLIELHFGVSKRVFKMAIGQLFKERKIMIEDDGIRLTDASEAKRPRQPRNKLANQTNTRPDAKRGQKTSTAKPKRQRIVNKKSTDNTLSLKK